MAQIRKAGPGDRGVMVAFHHALYADFRATLVPERLLELADYSDLSGALRMDVDSILARPDSIALLAESDERPIGYITGRVESDDRRIVRTRGIIEDWWVEPEERGTKVGRKLLDALLAEFRERGAGAVESTTWPKNTSAAKAHEAAGFELVEVKYRMKL